MSKVPKITLMLVAILCIASSSAIAASLQQDNHGIEAMAYLELLDQQNYQGAWDSMAPLYWAMNVQHQWQQKVSSIRLAYGSLTSRHIRSTSYRTSFRNAPDGTYIIVQFDSVFEHKLKGVETIVLQCSTSETCRVIDYVIN